MPAPDKVTLELKKILVDEDLKPIYEPNLIDPEKRRKLLKDLEGRPQMEREAVFQKESPPLYLGIAIKNLISRIAPANNEESADLFQWIVKIKNELITNKGELQVSKDEINKLIEILNKLKPELINVVINGQITQYLNEAKAKFYTTK